jgi:hypothetical protein
LSLQNLFEQSLQTLFVENLCLTHLPVRLLPFGQALMVTTFHDPALMHDENHIRLLYGSKAMSNHNSGSSSSSLL